jgi:anaerobic selenocysteine-containing dehydrogenase
MATHIHTCPLCEATCGLRIETEGQEVVSIRGDEDDVFSGGFLCPKAHGLKALHEDPDRLRHPLVRRDGELREASWAEAWQAVEDGLAPILEQHGRNAVAVYLGNPSAHNLAANVYGPVFVKALGSQNLYSASTVDQMPKQVSSAFMFGAGLSVPVPDLDRCEHLLVLGANPLVSNGSLMTSPNARGRIRAIRERGGKVVVIDPRRSRTAEEADEHHAIVPGTDAHLLFGIVHTLFDEGLADAGPLAEHCEGIDDVERLAAEFAPERVEAVCGIAASEIRRMARELAAAERGACYGRIGTCTQEFGTLASWLIDVVNVLTGNLDREGGAMFTKAAGAQRNSSGKPGTGKGFSLGRWHSRVRGLPEAFGELPVVCLAEEIETPGDGQVRALITNAGNPVVSTPHSERLDAALEGLDFMVSLDIYVNETTRHADVILPGPSPLARSHYDLALYQLAVRNVANYSAPAMEPEPDDEPEWRQLLRLTAIVTGQGADADIDAVDSFVIDTLIQRAVADEQSPVAGRDPAEVRAALDAGGRVGPDRALDLFLRSGPYGDGFGARPDGLSLDKLEQNPHGIDLGPLQPRIPEVLRTASGKIELAPAPLVADVERLRESLARTRNGHMVLIGRRQLRSNNSWMHNLPPLVKGKDRCTMQVHPDDATRLGLVDGAQARLTSDTGSIEAPIEVTDAIRSGVVSIPHGWGHDTPGVRLDVAREHSGVNSNVLADTSLIDPLSGNAVLNGIPVEVGPA